MCEKNVASAACDLYGKEEHGCRSYIPLDEDEDTLAKRRITTAMYAVDDHEESQLRRAGE